MDRRTSGFDKYSLEARKLANCVLCPRGFEQKVCLRWLALPVCQGCFIRKMDERNKELNAKIQSQGKDEQAKIAALKSKSNKRDGSSSSDIYSRQGSRAITGQLQPFCPIPGDTHSPQETNISALKSLLEIKGSGTGSEMSRTVDTFMGGKLE